MRWAGPTVREKILSGELDAAQALAPMPLAMSLGLNSPRLDCLTALVLTLHGNAVVLSRRLWSVTGGRPADLARCSRQAAPPIVLAAVYPHSTQLYLLREWLTQAGLVPDRDYRIVIVPPPQMVSHLKAGHIDGFCVGEPWASVAVRSGVGVIAALSADLAPGHAEKVLLVRASFARERREEHASLIRALCEACAWCASPLHTDFLIQLLSDRHGLALPPEVLRPALTGNVNLGAGRSRVGTDAMLFHGDDINEPDLRRVDWFARHVDPAADATLLGGVYRTDLYHDAIASSPRIIPPRSTEPRSDAVPCAVQV